MQWERGEGENGPQNPVVLADTAEVPEIWDADVHPVLLFMHSVDFRSSGC